MSHPSQQEPLMNQKTPLIVTDLVQTPKGPNGTRSRLPNQTLSLDVSLGVKPKDCCQIVSPVAARTTFRPAPENVANVSARDTAKLRDLISHCDTVLIDIRPFNAYSTRRLRQALNLCVPSTLLKRQSYSLDQMFAASGLPPDAKEKVLSCETTTVLIYDDVSTSRQVSLPMYQMLSKFTARDGVAVMFIDGGISCVDPSLIDRDSAPMKSPSSPQTPQSALISNLALRDCNGSPDSKSSLKDSLPFLTGFTLPSATSPDQKLLMAIRQPLPKIDTSSKFHANLRFPPHFHERKHRLPKWLSFFADFYNQELLHREILDLLNHKFNKLERAEQVRLSMAISNEKPSGGQHSHSPSAGTCTPNSLCPYCDKIDYSVPKGIELGFKNRYKNIWPYEHSRVKLVASPSNNPDTHDDYFNANYIHHSKLSLRMYIATQNPMKSTYEDFWNSVWYNHVRGIICLTTPPAFNPQTYYDHDQSYQQHHTSVKIDSQEIHDGYVLRTILLTKRDKTRTIYHFAYSDWPDFGTPENAHSVFDLIEKKNKKVPLSNEKHHSNGLLVHCAAGCGRTGSFISIDMVVDCFQQAKSGAHDPWGPRDLIYDSVQFERQQRLLMVQNIDQFVFCYESILEFVVEELLK